MKAAALLVILAVVTAWPADAIAQGSAGRVEVGIGGGLLGGAGLADDDAELRTRSGTNVALFGADSELSRAGELEVRGGIALTRRYSLELRAGISHPELRAVIAGDIEGAPDTTLVERLDRYAVDASFVARFDRLRIGPLVPFVAAGAGYLRQLHEGLMLVEQGTAYHVGGGARHDVFSGGGGMLKAAGVRGDVRVYLFSGGVALSGRPTAVAGASASLFVVF
jgi:hypothetical protein